MDISKMTVTEMEQRLVELWDRADSISSSSGEYDMIVDEVLCIRNYCRENQIELPDKITARF